MRYRKTLVQERAAEVNRIQKVLEGANIKLSAVVSDVSGRAILEQLGAGVEDPKALADLAKGKLKNKKEELAQALEGLMQPHQRFMISRQLAHITDLEELIEDLDQEIEKRLASFEEAVANLQTIPGVGRRTAEVIVTEVGPDASHFPTAQQLAAWAGLAPGNHESAGKRKSGRARAENRSLRTAMVEAAQAAGRSKGNYLSAQTRRLSRRMAKKKVVLAVAHSMIVAIWHILRKGEEYKDLGANYFQERDRLFTERQSIRRLESLGYRVTLEQIGGPAA